MNDKVSIKTTTDSIERFANAWSSAILLAAIALMGCQFIIAMLKAIPTADLWACTMGVLP